jgi:hypothetical protein
MQTEQDRGGGARCSAHVPRSAASPRISSFTSLRNAPHRPDPPASRRLAIRVAVRASQAKGVGWPAERSKGGGVGRRPAPGDMSAVGHPAPLAVRAPPSATVA